MVTPRLGMPLLLQLGLEFEMQTHTGARPVCATGEREPATIFKGEPSCRWLSFWLHHPKPCSPAVHAAQSMATVNLERWKTHLHTPSADFVTNCSCQLVSGGRSRDFTDPLRGYEKQPATVKGFFSWIGRSLHPFLPPGIRHTALPKSGIMARNRVVAVKTAHAWRALSRCD